MRKLFPFVLLILFSCHKEKNISPYNYTLAVGDSWTYQVTNYPATATDTVVFKITAGGPFSALGGPTLGTLFNTQTTMHGLVVDSGTIARGSNYYNYHGANGVQTFAGSGLFDGWVFTMPFQSNSSWSVIGGTAHVLSSGQNLTILGNSYTNVTVLTRTTITPGGSVTDTLYVAPGIGIVKWYNMQLISYHLQ
jgi:hypothetical protein